MRKRVIVIGGAALVVLIAGVVIFFVIRHNIEASAVHPNYATVSPNGVAVSQLGGWERISPTTSDPVFAYADEIDGVSISVSQQPLPPAFQKDTDKQVDELAKSYSATTFLKADGTKIYIGTSAKGPQSTILAKNGLLILIKSQSKISDTAWLGYVSSLK